MTKLRVHALCEHGLTREPYCSGHIRILRPLGHPTVSARVELTASRHYTPARPARHDVVVVERLWTPHIRLSVARDLIERVRESDTRLVFAVDDNMFDLAQSGVFAAWLGDEAVPILELFAREADGILTTTEPLRERMLRYNDRIAVVPNSLDERLMCARLGDRQLRSGGPLVIGYMGTRSHDEDLEMIAPALRQVYRRWGDAIAFQVVGAVADTNTLQRLSDLPIEVVTPPPAEAPYPLFFAWYSRTIAWDIGLAPLRENVFNVCKSDIKLLDYAAIGAAGVYSRIAPYSSFAERGLGLVADADPEAWAEALNQLIGDAALRRRIVEAADAHLHSERTLARRAGDFVDALESFAA